MEEQIQNKGNPVRGKRVLTYYCLKIVLNRLLDQHKINVPQLARATGIAKNTLYDWADGKKADNPEAVVIVAKYFGLNRDDLEFGTSKDQEQQAEIERLNEDIRKKEFELAKMQLDIMSYIEKIEKINKAG